MEDSVDSIVGYMYIMGQHLAEVSPAGVWVVIEWLKVILHRGNMGRRFCLVHRRWQDDALT